MAQWLFVSDINLSIEEDLSILLVDEYDLKTHIKVYHFYMTKWTPKNGEILKVRPDQRTSITNTQSQLRDVVMWLDIFLKEGLHVSLKAFHIFYVQAMKTAVGLK